MPGTIVPGFLVYNDMVPDKYVNPKFEEVSGYSEAELIGQRPSVLKGGDLDDEDYARMWKTILSGKEWKGIFHNRRKDGSMYWESALISPIRDDAGNITHFIGIKEDITRLREYQESLRLQARLRSRERFWDIRVPKIDSIFDNSLVPRPSWSPGVPPQHRKLVAATHRSPI